MAQQSLPMKRIIFPKKVNQTTAQQINYVMNRLLGKGSFGKVYLGYDLDNPSKFYAVKVMKRSEID